MKTDSKDRLEKFVENNRQAFDTEQPSKRVWNGVSQSLIMSKLGNKTHWLWKAASIVFFLTSSYLYFQIESDATNQSIKPVAVVDEEFEATEDYYVSLISEKRDQIYDFSSNEIEANGLYEVDIEQLEAMYEVLKTQYNEIPSKELQEAMTLNLIVRIDLLNQQLSEIEGVKKQKEMDAEVEV